MAITSKQLYSMKLHDIIHNLNDDVDIVRVPGGWIYTIKYYKTSIFVPFNNEFEMDKNT